MIKAISFDFWESLFGFVDEGVLQSVRRERTRLLSKLLGRTEGEVDNAYSQVAIELTEWRESTGFEFCVEHLMEEFLKRIKAPLNLVPECKEIFTRSIKKYFPGPNPGAEEVVKELHNRGFKLAITSNTIHGDLEEELLEEWRLSDLFEIKALSCKLGVRKPRKDIFLWVSYRLEVHPSQLIHVGDDPEADVKGALGAGLWSGYYIKQGREPLSYAHLNIREWREFPLLLEQLL